MTPISIRHTMRLALYNKKLHLDDHHALQKLFDAIQDLSIEVCFYKPFLQEVQKGFKLPSLQAEAFESYEEFMPLNCDFFLTLGGDGTILDSLTIIRDTRTPVLGINLGRLGFLANVEKANVRHALEGLMQGAYILDSRSLLHLDSSRPLFGGFNFALNDCTILKRDTSSMVIVHTYLNGEFLNSYWADGIIIATPTGSTGYSLSCGGPIVFPDSNNFVITPVAPHNLNVRPIIISDNSVISFEVEGRAKNFLCTLDSRYEAIDSIDQLAVRKADFPFFLVRFPERNFLSTIRDKMNWGIDIRN